MYHLDLDRRVADEIRTYPPKHAKQVSLRIFALASDPRPPDCRKLAGAEDVYRVDQGEYRIIYAIDDRAHVVTVYIAGSRNDDEIYKKFARMK
jgi:mRNA interferase RelE/StbE